MGLCWLKTWCLQALFPLRYIHANSGERSVPEVCAERMQVSPVKGTVGFASAQSGWSFTLQSFSKLYCEVYGIQLDHLEFARRLWGDLYFHPGDADPIFYCDKCVEQCQVACREAHASVAVNSGDGFILRDSCCWAHSPQHTHTLTRVPAWEGEEKGC